ncbi:MAG: acetyl-CoA C-acyltransferase [Erysipelotrichaceae bacterium]|nr:acetyl-CoA C-acyltransferase [Erysipelotrichaceae bacterium]
MNRKKFIIEAKRTAIGRFLGSLYEKDVVDVSKQLIEKGFSAAYLKDVQQVIVGNVISAGMGQGVARAIAINSGIDQSVPAYSVNMVCGSGMQAIINACNEIECGKDLILAGGVEFMSNIPYATNTFLRLGKKFGNFEMTDLMVSDGLTDSFSGVHMGITAENIAREYGISRKAQDDYAYLTQQRAIRAVDSGVFKDEIVPVNLRDYRGREFAFDTDEFPNRDSTREKMSSLKPTFIKDETGTITAANTSGINDGACFLLIASQDYCQKNGIDPLAEIVDHAVVGLDPQFMGLGPYYAIRELCQKSGVSFKELDYFEINEAFAAQVLGCFKLLEEEYGVDEKYLTDRCNRYGSGLGLGHPLGMTGARITTTLAYEMNRNSDIRYGVASLCIGGGMGAALLLKRN